MRRHKFPVVALCLAVALLLGALPSFAHARPVAAQKPERTMTILDIRNPADHNQGRANARYVDGFLLLHYDKTSSAPLTLQIDIADETGAPLLKAGQAARLSWVNPRGVIDPTALGTTLTAEDMQLSIRVDPSYGFLSFALETSDALYTSANIPVLWRDMPGVPAFSVSVWPSDDFALGVGQEVKLAMTPDFLSSDMRLRITPATYDKFIAFNAQDMTVRGMIEGEQMLLVQNSAGTTLSAVKITVQKQSATFPEPQLPDYPVYRVLPRTLGVYATADDKQSSIGRLLGNMRVHVAQIDEHFALLDVGVYVPARYLVKLEP